MLTSRLTKSVHILIKPVSFQNYRGFSTFSNNSEISISTPDSQADKLKTNSTQSKPRKKKTDAIDPEKQAKLALQEEYRKKFHWTLAKIKEIRKERDAPVDTVGYKSLSDALAPQEVQDFQSLVALILSVQSKDHMTAAVMERFIKHGLSLEKVNKMSEEEIQEIIKSSNFYKKKAKFIKQAATIITEKYHGKIPEKLEELLEFPGIGYKIAILYLNKPEKSIGIGVDTHVHRISNRLGWVNTKIPDKTRIELESFIEQEYWGDINHWLVGFGQQVCLPVNPKCGICLLNSECPTAKKPIEKGK